MAESVEAGERVVFGICGDIAKAHRRVRHSERDWGVLACRASPLSQTVWLNRVGTFGIASAAWPFGTSGSTRGRDWVWALVFVDDLQIAAGGSNRWLTIWRFLVCLIMAGVPFAYHKFRGGLQLDFVGYWLDYTRFSLGIAERRVRWILDFVASLERDGSLVEVRRYQEFHGRLGFMLPWIRPFLAPGYAWLAKAKPGAVMKVPDAVSFCNAFIRDKLMAEVRLTPCHPREWICGELFRCDAKCAEQEVVLGGWLCLSQMDPAKAPWYSLRLSPKDVPCLFRSGASSWASATAEHLAALVSFMVLPWRASVPDQGSVHNLVLVGGTDNAAQHKDPSHGGHDGILSSSRFGRRPGRMDWRPRDENQPADDLTNSKFDLFDKDLRVHVEWNKLQFHMLHKLITAVQCLSTQSADSGMEGSPNASGSRPSHRKPEWA